MWLCYRGRSYRGKRIITSFRSSETEAGAAAAGGGGGDRRDFNSAVRNLTGCCFPGYFIVLSGRGGGLSLHSANSALRRSPMNM